ncbi:putative menaquinone biosynthesis protein [Caldithrix abyssi DSM 13497]|uniref:Aminodeoxyfutalosine synthase n=1 Tax=Caldithrix abyssi DSM 13497 TaxID=880073 RepID=H1XR19_CALAY|nr:aminofutalosine synthase MqnE [Caldithrix abyssi]APF20034.1 mqnE aminodeoxyfutalosine synthase [Caldithrix abyssi DSM 13497]EHO40113.1 putative menaquinone biosynthesis protein [Caldithrix abyssi DSM 13497]
MTDSNLKRIYDKVMAGERLSFEDGMTLFNSNDVLTIGEMAHHIRVQKNGLKTFYTLNQHINPTNICRNDCLFCAFYRKDGQEGAYRMSLETVRQKVLERIEEPITEIHIVGGLDDGLPYEYYIDVLRVVKEVRPNVNIKAYTAVEIAYLAERSGKSWAAVLDDLLEAGLNTMPGGGAEVFSERVKRKLFMDKLSADEWIEIHKIAHQKGIRTNATMLYGHIEKDEEKVDHLIRLRKAQDESGGFLTFLPLLFHPENTRMARLPMATGVEDLKHIAISRLLLDNFDHIKAYWVMLGKDVAQIALSFGADDIDGSVVEERIYHMAGARSSQMMTRSQLKKLISECGFVPVERNALYQSVNTETEIIDQV